MTMFVHSCFQHLIKIIGFWPPMLIEGYTNNIHLYLCSISLLSGTQSS